MLPRERAAESLRGFTLLELLIVVGIIGLLLVLIAPAFTYIKGGTDMTSAELRYASRWSRYHIYCGVKGR
jgi:prepilin-type N-terminal cleavage/methylation domain-containing protein